MLSAVFLLLVAKITFETGKVELLLTGSFILLILTGTFSLDLANEIILLESIF